MDNYNVIGDIAGNYLTLKALLSKMPREAVPFSLGDMNDRGPRSRQVIEFFMEHGKAVNSNHGHMMVHEWEHNAMPGAFPKYYDLGLWIMAGNGGSETLSSYAVDWKIRGIDKAIPGNHITYLKNLPMYMETNKYFMSHAPLNVKLSPEEASKIGTGFSTMLHDYESEYSLLWNRYAGNRPNPYLKGKMALFGHNSSDQVKVYTPQFTNGIKMSPDRWKDYIASEYYNVYPVYQMGIDTSGGKILTGLHLPTLTLYQQEYID